MELPIALTTAGGSAINVAGRTRWGNGAAARVCAVPLTRSDRIYTVCITEAG